jgi:3-hydroxy-3-methylglutaryl CoA synthase
MGKPAGIVSVGAYLPRLRLPRARIAEAVAWMSPASRTQAQGARTVCNWDEDAITLAVEAARACVAGRAEQSIDLVALASTTLPFADRDNAALLVGALDLPESTRSVNVSSSLRAGTSAVADALRRRDETSLVIASDARRAQPGSAQELSYGHGAAALLITPDTTDALAAILASAHLSADFVDHYRMAGEDFDNALEDRWVRDEALTKLIPRAVASALAASGLKGDDIATLVAPGGATALQRIAEHSGLVRAKTADTLQSDCGDTGSAHALLMLVAALESAAPGDRILVIGFGQGVDALVVEVKPAIEKRRPHAVSAALARGIEESSYVRYLAHAQLLDVDFGMRAERDNRTAQTVAYRKRRAVTGFFGGRCAACETVQFPQSRVCVNPECRKTDTQHEYRLADGTGRIKSFTEDWQAYSPRPPCIYGNVEFAEGGNLLMEMTDVEPGELAVNAPMRFVFRIKDVDRMRGFQRYFWKATGA